MRPAAALRLLIASSALVALALAGCSEASPAGSPGGPDAGVGGSDQGFQTQDGASLDTGGTPGPVNSAPGPLTAQITPEAPTTSDPIVVSIVEDALDPDDGPDPLEYRYTWFKDGEQQPNTSETVPPEVTRRGETWRVEVAGWDGLDRGEVWTGEVVVGNSAPSVSGVSIAPTDPDVESVLVCDAATRSDPDDDDISLTYRWTRGGQTISGATTGALQPPLELGASYRCHVTPFDGELEGEEVGSDPVVPVAAPVPTEALISINPKSVDLGVVVPGQVSEAELVVVNIGDGQLEISAATLSGDAGFGVQADVPWSLAPGEQKSATVSFQTDVPGLKKGSVTFESNASNTVSETVPLLGVGAAPCLKIQPSAVDFGGVYLTTFHEEVVTMTSCGGLPVTVDSITLLAPDDSPFQLNTAPGPGPLPWVINPGEEAQLKITFAPFTASAVDAEGQPIPDTAELSVLSNALNPLAKVPVSGFGSDQSCPVPVIEVAEGFTVLPNTELHLSALKSFAPGGAPGIYTWGVTTPGGGSGFSPSIESPEVTYTVAGPGDYVFELNVFDIVDGQCSDGTPCKNDDECSFGGCGGDLVPGCSTATRTVTVKDATPIIIEMTWDTPGDPDQDDEDPGAGADLDLHMHNNAEGAGGPDYDGDGFPDLWFDLKNDLFWFDKSPPWGAEGDENDPLMVLEDANGKGPERFEYPLPAPGSYTVGVHCWSDYGWGPSVATVRIWFFEELVWEKTDVVLGHEDLWEVATIHWPSQVIVEAVGGEGGAKITPEYPNPFFQ